MVRRFTPAPAGAVRALRVPAGGAARPRRPRVAVASCAPRSVTALLRPVRAAAAQASAPAAAFAAQAVGAPGRARPSSRQAGPPASGSAVPGRALRPGTYRLEVSAAEPGTDLGRLHIVRRLTVR